MEKFNQTLFSYFGMLLLCLMVKMFELKELCFVLLMESPFTWRTMETDPDAMAIDVG